MKILQNYCRLACYSHFYKRSASSASIIIRNPDNTGIIKCETKYDNPISEGSEGTLSVWRACKKAEEPGLKVLQDAPSILFGTIIGAHHQEMRLGDSW